MQNVQNPGVVREHDQEVPFSRLRQGHIPRPGQSGEGIGVPLLPEPLLRFDLGSPGHHNLGRIGVSGGKKLVHAQGLVAVEEPRDRFAVYLREIPIVGDVSDGRVEAGNHAGVQPGNHIDIPCCKLWNEALKGGLKLDHYRVSRYGVIALRPYVTAHRKTALELSCKTAVGGGVVQFTRCHADRGLFVRAADRSQKAPTPPRSHIRTSRRAAQWRDAGRPHSKSPRPSIIVAISC